MITETVMLVACAVAGLVPMSYALPKMFSSFMEYKLGCKKLEVEKQRIDAQIIGRVDSVTLEADALIQRYEERRNLR